MSGCTRRLFPVAENDAASPCQDRAAFLHHEVVVGSGGDVRAATAFDDGSIKLPGSAQGRKHPPNELDHRSVVRGCARHRRILASPEKVPLSSEEEREVVHPGFGDCFWLSRQKRDHQKTDYRITYYYQQI